MRRRAKATNNPPERIFEMKKPGTAGWARTNDLRIHNPKSCLHIGVHSIHKRLDYGHFCYHTGTSLNL